MKRRLLITSFIAIVITLVIGSGFLYAESIFNWYPRLGNVTTDGIEVVFKTVEEVDTYVRYASKDEYDAKKGWSGKSETFHGTLFRISLKGLKPNTQYVYQVMVNGQPATKVYSFFTAPEKPIEFTFLAYGDTRTHQDKHKLLADKMARDETNPRFVIHVGDLVTNGKENDEWLDFSKAIKELGASMPYYSAIGNHEYNSDNYYNSLALPRTGGGQNNSEWYSFDYAGVHFIVLDSNIMDKYVNENVPNAVEKQAEWIIKDLEAHKDAKWIIAVFHHPVFSSHQDSRYPQLQKEWIPIFDKYGVDLVLSGHNHIYERVLSGGRNYIVTGCGGAPFDYIWEYEPRLKDSVCIEDAVLQYTRVRVTEEKLYVEVVQTHEEADDYVTLNENFKIIDKCEIENILPEE
ncbi:purple acid phosphatase family protein [Anoxybacter fermentans]|uniref:purple acid phosphatase family protein n=1 Tax=Anoxybacter fermentans TaxID=1323375 RepID=UPI0013E0BF31|nr:metallophosphoesterase family protein [Anoxybacter fermentans]